MHQENQALGVAWDLVKSVYKLKHKDKSYVLLSGRPRPLQKSPEEREIVVDSGASMHMLSKKDFSSDEMETLWRSRIPTVITANGEVQTNGEAQVYVHDLDLFVTVQILEDTPVLLLGKLCDEHGCFYKWVSGKQPRLTKQGKKKHILQNGRFRTSWCPWIVEFIYISIAGETKSSTREVNLWYKILPLSGFNLIRAKQKQTSQET